MNYEIHNYDTTPDCLKPCPFCGEKPIWYCKGNYQQKGDFAVVIKCHHCGVTMEQAVKKQSPNWLIERMVNKWNERKLQTQLPANLDEAAKKWLESYCTNEKLTPASFLGFKAGAKWMAEQGYSQKTYIYANRFNDENEAVIQLGRCSERCPEKESFLPGDKVIVQIRKTK